MSIEPSAVRFTIGTRIVPPEAKKPEGIRISEDELAWHMARDAKQVMRRVQKQWGRTQDGGPGLSANQARRDQARERRNAFAARILALLAEKPLMPTRQIEDALNLSQEQTRTILTELRKAGTVSADKGHNGHFLWKLP